MRRYRVGDFSLRRDENGFSENGFSVHLPGKYENVRTVVDDWVL